MGELNTGELTLALTILVEILAAGIFIGVVRNTLTNVVKELHEHETGDVAKTHGCLLIKVTHREGER